MMGSRALGSLRATALHADAHAVHRKSAHAPRAASTMQSLLACEQGRASSKGHVMNDFAAVSHGLPKRSGASDEDPHQPIQPGVGGWLLALCWMLTIIGPLLSVGLLSEEYAPLAKYLSSPGEVQAVIALSIALTLLAVLYGMWAGFRLWTIRPGAVATAKRALLVGLAVDLITSALQVSVALESPADGSLLQGVMQGSALSLVFFTACYAYLNKSARVQATYRL